MAFSNVILGAQLNSDDKKSLDTVPSITGFVPFAEPALSTIRFFAFTPFRVRMTKSEGFRVGMTTSEKRRMTIGCY